VHGAIGEEGEDGGANVAAARPGPTSTAAGAAAEPATAHELLAAAAMAGMTWMVVM
jgi:hypothetical protein